MTSSSLRRRAALLALPAAAALLAASSGTPAGAASGKTVVLKDIAFKPGNVTIAKGQSVTWKWDDDRTEHNVRSTGAKRFKGSPIQVKGTHRVTFTKAGTYRYVCTLHFGMSGKITVK